MTGRTKKRVVAPEIGEEMSGVALGHVWRDQRAAKLVRAMAEHPAWSFPNLLPHPSELEAGYRFFNNEKVTPEALLKPHAEASFRRAAELKRTVCVVHDTTELRFGGEAREGLGYLSGNGQGMLLHASMLVDPVERMPLGVVSAQYWYPKTPAAGTTTRQRSNAARDIPREDKSSILWDRGIERSEEVNNGRFSLVHVGDRATDDYALLGLLKEKGLRFVLRSKGYRNVTGRPGETVHDVAQSAPIRLHREVPLSERRPTKNGRPRTEREKKLHPPRRARMANLEVRACTITLKRTPLAQTNCRSVTLNLVLVTEVDVPPGEEPIEWLLYTSEPVDTPEQVASVLDAYASRWLIEEYFKALKTGCAAEERQLESANALERMLALFLPVAWRLLVIRTIARNPAHNDVPARAVFDEVELEVLQVMSVRVKLSSTPTLREAYLALAGLGGHLKRNGEPGWRTLSFGFQRFLEAVHVTRQLARRR